MHSIFTAVLIALTVSVAPAASAAGDVKINDNGLTCFNGYGYTLDSHAYRYTEHHEQKRRAGKLTTWNVTYVGKSGQIIGRKHMDFSDDPTVPVYTMRLADGYREGIRHADGQWTMFERDSADAEQQTEPFEIRPPMAADAGFDALVKKHFAKLMSGQSLAFAFVAAGRQSVISLKAHKSATTTFAGKPAVVFESELDIPIIHWFVDSIKLTYDPKTKQLLVYRGIGNMHNADGEVYPVRVGYDKKMPAVAKQNGAPAAACGSTAGKN